jgi:hypothetical protein
MGTLREAWAILVSLWNTGNRLARWTIGIIGFWPIVLIGVAITGIPTLTSLLALLPVLAIILLLLALIDPLVLAVIGSFERGRSALRISATIIGAELVIGVYFSVIPVWKDRGLVPLLVLILAAIGFLAAGLQGKIAKGTISILVLLAIILTITFISGGREGLYQKWENLTTAPPALTPTIQPTQWQLCWEKIPGAQGTTNVRSKCFPVRVIRDRNSIVLSYDYNDRQGTMEASARDGAVYAGLWKDPGGWGNFQIRFTSPTSAVGWTDEKGKNPINLWLSLSK